MDYICDKWIDKHTDETNPSKYNMTRNKIFQQIGKSLEFPVKWKLIKIYIYEPYRVGKEKLIKILLKAVKKCCKKFPTFFRNKNSERQ